ncbi:uncharacterized protein AB9W97_018935 [Spinachia spinachia]
MSACCVSGCKSTSTGGLEFFKVPVGSMPFTANRRRLWLKALERVNGSADELGRNAFVCSAHLKSQRAALNPDSPDFVPSVFTCAKPNRRKTSQRPIRRRHHNTRVAVEEKATPPRVDSSMVLRSSVMVELTQTPSTPSAPQEGETLTQELQTETTPVKSQSTSSPHMASASFKTTADIPPLDKGSPFVLLKNIYRSSSGYQCEHCDLTFATVSQLMEHRKRHSSIVCEKCGLFFKRRADFAEHQCVPEPSFLCNMCNRSFSTSPELKRHRLTHVKDGRKCPTCAVLFCQRHNHVLFLPLPPSITEYEEDCTATEPQKAYGALKDETPVPGKPEANADRDHRAESSMTNETPCAKISSEIFVPRFRKPPSKSGLPPLVTKVTRKPAAASRPASFSQPLLPQHAELPPSLKLFSPKYLTSAFLQVKRNYQYILSKPKGVNKTAVKEEPCERPPIPPNEQSVAHIKKERTAYNLEVGL